RLDDIALLTDMLGDNEWPLEPGDRRRVLAAISYFAVPKDMISDKIPAIGYLDDALVAELVTQELRHDLEGYREFCAYRKNETAVRDKEVSREDWLEARRGQLVRRIGRRRERMLERRREQGRLTDPILRYKY
ncbi:MAG: YkvA family protein, partial [Rhodanobacter sp.]